MNSVIFELVLRLLSVLQELVNPSPFHPSFSGIARSRCCVAIETKPLLIKVLLYSGIRITIQTPRTPTKVLWAEFINKFCSVCHSQSVSLPFFFFLFPPCSSPLILGSSSPGRTLTWRWTNRKTATQTSSPTITPELCWPPWMVRLDHTTILYHYCKERIIRIITL